MRYLLTRVQILGRGRRAYLEYLRNITPQIFLCTFVLITAEKLSKVNVADHLALVLLLFVLFFGFLCAFIANAVNLHSECYSSLSKWSRRVGMRVRAKPCNMFTKTFMVFSAAARRKPIELSEYLIVFYLIQAIAIVIVYQASFVATSFLTEAPSL